jgi:small subunit ribosomal protein S3
MGQKVCPIGFRVGVKVRTGPNQKRNVEEWRSRWFASKKNFSRCLIEDHKIRAFVKKHFYSAGIPKIEIERRGEDTSVRIHTARPGLLIGRKGAKVEKLKSDLEALIGRVIAPPQIIQVDRPDLEAQLVAESVAEQLEKRASFRRVLKKTLDMTFQAGALGVKIMVSGRLGGSDMSRREHSSVGKLPLQTIRANIDYGFAEAKTSYGRIGVKVWIYKGDILTEEERLKDGSDAKKGQAPKAAARKDPRGRQPGKQGRNR